jgi:serine/threonine protein kinase
MTQTPDSDDLGPPSPVHANEVVAERFLVGSRYGVRGDVHLHHGSYHSAHGEYESVRLAVFRYRGAEPLPRFLELLRTDAERWGSLHALDGRSVDGRLPAIVPTLEVGRMVNTMTCYWVQEDPRGVTLAEKLDRPLSPRYALYLALELGAALHLVHSAGLVHGDLDPSHVHLLGNLDAVRLSWGGLAHRVESAGMDAGRGLQRSLAEVAPEVLQGRWNDPRSDLYGLASLLYRMLAGQPPWLVRRRGPLPGVSAEEPLPPMPEWVRPDLVDALTAALQRELPRRPELSEWLDRIAAAHDLYADADEPPGTFSPTTASGEGSVSVGPMPPTLNRTLSPVQRLDEQDSALSNTPAPTQRMVTPTSLQNRVGSSPPAGSRSFVPPAPRSQPPHMPPPALTPLPAPPRVLETSLAFLLPISAFGMLGFGMGILLLALSWVLWTTQGASPQRQAPPPQEVPAPVPTAPLPAPAPAAPAPAPPAVYEVRSEPSGAELWEGEILHGRTPIEVALTGSVADPPREFQLRMPGYAPYTLVQPYRDGRSSSHVHLQRLRVPVPAPPPAEPAPVPVPQLPIIDKRTR